LNECLALFESEEQLTKENQWFCPKCKQWQEATKKLDIWKLPPILIIHLKRFAFTHWFRSKLEMFVHFPLENFDLGEFVVTSSSSSSSSHIYDLYAVINHYGGLGGGHYTAHVRRVIHNTSTWYHFDDTVVTQVHDPQREVVTPAAYILFYKRRDFAFEKNVATSSSSCSHCSSSPSASSSELTSTSTCE
jgi:ubiquitin carboxyl-terminal hydrolase 4/11/15